MTEEIGKGSVLIADDDEDIRILLSRTLQRGGYEIAGEAHNGVQALDMTLALQPDVILMDIKMPEMDGLEAARKIQETCPTPIVVLTAYESPGFTEEAGQSGASAYLVKPIKTAELERAMVIARARHDDLMNLRRLNRELGRKNAQLQEAMAVIDRDLEAAAGIQHNLLPAENIDIPGIRTAWRYEPYGRVGGDMFNVFKLGPGHVGVYLTDVSGHGVQAALLSVTLSRILTVWREGASVLKDKSGGLRSPSEVIGILNRRFQISIDHAQYFTMIYGMIDLREGMLTYARGGHPAMIVVPPDGRIPPVDRAGSLPVGWRPDTVFSDRPIPVEPGTRLFLYSDGITESRGTSSRGGYGLERLMEQIKNHTGCALREIIDAVIDDFKRWLDGIEPEDDIAMVGIEITGS